MNKKGFEFSFGWLFAIIVGAAIIFLAIYASVKLISTERIVQDTEIAKKLENILTPVETGAESGRKIEPITFSSLTKISNSCTNEKNFGEQKLAVATSSGIGKKWQDSGFNATSYNKYIFSSSTIEGKEIYVFSKPFNMPFKIANILFIWTGKYCFVKPYSEIKDELIKLNLKNVNITNSPINCEKNSKKICFDEGFGNSCNVTVYSDYAKYDDGKMVYYTDSLVYGAIFSDYNTYECQVRRLMKRASELARLYNSKSEEISVRASGCSSHLQGDLTSFADKTAKIEKSESLDELYLIKTELKNKNDKITTCKLW